MNQLTSILYASLTWVMGVCVFLGSYAIPLLENPELQANIALAIFIIPIACLGTHLYYRRGGVSPLSLAFIFIAVAILLDAAITVPVFIIPAGGSYLEFFGNLSFYLIVLEFFLTVLLFGQYLTNKTSKV